MFGPFKLSSPFGAGYGVDPSDTLNAKRILSVMGYYRPSENGLTPYPDSAIFDAIKSFQSDNGLRKDGVMKPGGETETTLNQHLARRFVKKAVKALNSDQLFSAFDKYRQPDFHAEGSAESTRCCATGTCDITW
jgi:hypothetical protein